MISQKDVLFLENEIIDPFWVIDYLEKNVPRQLTAEILIKVLRKMIRRTKGCTITYHRSRKAKDVFIVNGFFDKDKKRKIEVQICCSSFKKRILLSRKLRQFLIFELADTLCHESVHRYQQSMRIEENDYRDDDQITYYANKDEMFAYAINIAHSIYRKHGNLSLLHFSDLEQIASADQFLSEYYYYFYNQKVFKKMIKMVYQHLVALDEGRFLHRPATSIIK